MAWYPKHAQTEQQCAHHHTINAELCSLKDGGEGCAVSLNIKAQVLMSGQYDKFYF